MGAILNVVLSSEGRSDTSDCLFHVNCKVTLAREQVIVLEEVLHALCLLVNMLDGFVDAVLANVFTWEFVTILVSSVKWHRKMTEVDGFTVALFEVTGKPGEEMSLWHWQCSIAVELLHLRHKLSGEVLVSNVQH